MWQLLSSGEPIYYLLITLSFTAQELLQLEDMATIHIFLPPVTSVCNRLTDKRFPLLKFL